MLRTALLSLVFVLLAAAGAAELTAGFQVWTAEGARRLAVAERPVPAPDVVLGGPGIAGRSLPQWLAGDGRVTIASFVYTRCTTVCTALGSGFQQLQQSIADERGVKLLSISFDPAHDDETGLQRYASTWRADPRRWSVATVPDATELQRLLQAFQVVVIDDGLGGYEHNAALLVIDARGRLVRIFDADELGAALAYARAIVRKDAGRVSAG